MTIAGTQTAAALPAQAATAAHRASAMPAAGDHGTTASASTKLGATGSPASQGAALMPGPYFSPFDRIQSLLADLMQAIQQLNQPPIGPYPPYDPYGPYGPYPPIEPPYGCPHMLDMPPIPIDPMPPVTKKAPEVGDVLAVVAPSASAPFGEVKVKSVHGTYQGRDKAVAAAKHLSGIFGNALFGVAVSGLPGKEKYTVVGLNSDVPLDAKSVSNLIGQPDDGWALDTITFSATSAKRVPLGTPPVGIAMPGAAAAPTAPRVPAPAPAPHTH